MYYKAWKSAVITDKSVYKWTKSLRFIHRNYFFSQIFNITSVRQWLAFSEFWFNSVQTASKQTLEEFTNIFLQIYINAL